VTLYTSPLWVIYHTVLVLLSVNLHTKHKIPSFTYSKDVTGAPKFKNQSLDTDTSH